MSIEKLALLAEQADTISHIMHYEAQVCKAEREEAFILDLHDDERIKHYNEWMVRHNLDHLVIKD